MVTRIGESPTTDGQVFDSQPSVLDVNGGTDGKKESRMGALDKSVDVAVDVLSPTIERMVGQCYALLRQQLERKVAREPATYNTFGVAPIMREFQSARQYVEATIAERVKSGILELMQREARSIFDDALNTAENLLAGTPRSEGVDGTPLGSGQEACRRFEGRRPEVGRDSGQPNGRTGMDEFPEGQET